MSRCRLAFAFFGLAPFLAACQAGEVGATDEAAIDAELVLCAAGPTVAGVDVSHHQGKIHWAQVKASGKAFAIIRVSDGANNPDAYFDANWQGAAENGLVRAAYQYFEPGQDPIAQAQLLLDQVGALGPNDLPPMLDIEVMGGVSASVVVSRARQWLDHVEAALGRRPLVYMNPGFAAHLGDPAALATNELWIANWRVACPRTPPRWSAWRVWQTRVASSAPGFTTPVDLDLFNGSIEQLRAFAGPTP